MTCLDAGTADLRLSNLAALAHALDPELALVPRKAVPALRALSRNAADARRKDIVAAQKDIQRFRVPTLELKGLKQLRQALEQISRPTQEMATLGRSITLMQAVRNTAAHGLRPDADDTPSRPARSLDAEEDDA